MSMQSSVLAAVPRATKDRYFGDRRHQRSCTTQGCGDCPGCRMRQAWARGDFDTRRKGFMWDGWTREQDDRLRELAGTRPIAEIAAALAEQFGVPRTVASLRIRAKALGISLWAKGLSMRDLERLFGVDHRAILRWWITPGLLVGQRWDGRGMHRGWWFEEAEVARFIRAAPWTYDVARMLHGHPLSLLAEAMHRSDGYLTLAETEKALGRAPGVLDKWIRRGLVPHQRRAGAGGKGEIVVRRKDIRAIGEAIDAEIARARSEAASRRQIADTRKRIAYRVGYVEGFEAALHFLTRQGAA